MDGMGDVTGWCPVAPECSDVVLVGCWSVGWVARLTRGAAQRHTDIPFSLPLAHAAMDGWAPAELGCLIPRAAVDLGTDVSV